MERLETLGAVVAGGLFALGAALLAARGWRRDRLVVHVNRTREGFEVIGTDDVEAGRALVFDYCRRRLLDPPRDVLPRVRALEKGIRPKPEVRENSTFWRFDPPHPP